MLYVLGEIHPQPLLDYAENLGYNVKRSLDELISIHDSEYVEKSLIRAINNPDEPSITPFEQTIQKIARNITLEKKLRRDAEEIEKREREIIERVRPDIFYIEGTKRKMTSYISKAIQGKDVVWLDEGFPDLEMLREIKNLGQFRSNRFYGVLQRDREIYWVKEKINISLLNGKNGVAIVGKEHIEENDRGFGRLLKLLEEKNIDIKTVPLTDLGTLGYMERLGLDDVDITRMFGI